MAAIKKHSFKAKLEIIGINPFVFLPQSVLEAILKQAQKAGGKVPVKGKVNNINYRQTLVKYAGEWRLYINTKMLKDSPKRIGEMLNLSIEIDTEERTIYPHPKLLVALRENPDADAVFQRLSPSLQKEIIRYISFLKTEESIDRNVTRAINFLLGKERFIGRQKPEIKK